MNMLKASLFGRHMFYSVSFGLHALGVSAEINVVAGIIDP
jgi:hypothetical protein